MDCFYTLDINKFWLKITEPNRKFAILIRQFLILSEYRFCICVRKMSMDELYIVQVSKIWQLVEREYGASMCVVLYWGLHWNCMRFVCEANCARERVFLFMFLWQWLEDGRKVIRAWGKENASENKRAPCGSCIGFEWCLFLLILFAFNWFYLLVEWIWTIISWANPSKRKAQETILISEWWCIVLNLHAIVSKIKLLLNDNIF